MLKINYNKFKHNFYTTSISILKAVKNHNQLYRAKSFLFIFRRLLKKTTKKFKLYYI